MNDKNFDDFLRQQLQNASPYLDNANFSAKVIAGLPKPRRLSRSLELFIMVAPVTLIALLVMSQFSVGDFIPPIYAWILSVDMAGFMSLGVAVRVAMLSLPLLLLKWRAFF